MSFQTTPSGSRGARGAGSGAVMRTLMRVMTSWHKRSGDKFQGMDLLYLTTVGAKTGQHRQSTVARFSDGEDAWLVVASAGGSARHPAWYHNIAAHPSQVWIELGGQRMRVTPVAAVIGMTRGLARDLGADKIRLNAITPGWIMTQRQIDLWLTPEAEADLMKAQCLKEKVYPPDIARMALFLASDDSRLITAQNFVVDGGRM